MLRATKGWPQSHKFVTINWTQHGTNDFLGQELARGKGIYRTSMSSCKWGIIPNKALIRMGDWCGFIIRN